MVNIVDRAYADLSLDSVDPESTVLGDCQFHTYAIIRPNCISEKVIIPNCS